MIDVNKQKEIHLDLEDLNFMFTGIGKANDMILLEVGESKTYRTVNSDDIISYEFPEDEISNKCILKIYNLTDNTEHELVVTAEMPMLATFALENEPMEIAVPTINYLVIDEPTRIINVPHEESIFGTEYEKDAEEKYFKMPRYVDNNIDLSKLSIQVVYQNAVKEIGKSVVKDIRTTAEEITFKWVLPASAVGYMGTVNFLVKAVKTDSQGTETIVWSTTVAQGTVLKGLNDGDIVLEPADKDTIAQFMQELENAKNQALKEISAQAKANWYKLV